MKKGYRKVSGKSCNNSISAGSNESIEEFKGIEESQDKTVSSIFLRDFNLLLRCKLIIEKSLFNQALQKNEKIFCLRIRVPSSESDKLIKYLFQ